MSVVNIAKESLPDGFQAGNGTVGTTAALLTSIAFPVNKHVVVRATTGNSGTIKIGAPGQAGTGFILGAGETSPPIYVESTDKIQLVGSASGQGYSWVKS